MSKVISISMVIMLAAVAAADEGTDTMGDWLGGETLTADWFGMGETLGDVGLSIGADSTHLYQVNAGGNNVQTNKKAQRYTMSFGVEAELDLEKLIGLPGGSLYSCAEGSWHDGIDGDSVGSYFGVNDDAGGNRSFDILEVFYNQSLLDGKLNIKFGKLDVCGGYDCGDRSGAFDGNCYSEDETSQFLNGSLTGTPIIPSPDEGFGVVAQFTPNDRFYIAAGISDATADARETGFDTAFDSEDSYFAITEIGVRPLPMDLPGTYRFGCWMTDASIDDIEYRSADDKVGAYLSCDQALMSENGEDDQGLGAFVRFALNEDNISEIECFWAFGCQYQGLIPNRDNDVIGIGHASGTPSNYGPAASHREMVTEAYYNVHLTDFFQIAPDIQYIHNPGYADGRAIVVALRAQITF